MGFVHADDDHETGYGGESGDAPYSGLDTEGVGDDTGENRADREASVAPEPVDADG